ncbi:GIY-YIG nuclease family protein [Actinosynnema sp. NPDC059797]
MERLLSPDHAYSRDEVRVRGKSCPIPAQAGVYAWYFDEVPSGVPTTGCRVTEAGTLLYVGIAPKQPPTNGRRPSGQSLRTRVRAHFTGNAAGSTLRLSLGCHLAEQLGITLRQVGTKRERFTFTPAGEAKLSEWMGAHARVAFVEVGKPWLLEHMLFTREVLPLNLEGNTHSLHHAALTALRARCREEARSLEHMPDRHERHRRSARGTSTEQPPRKHARQARSRATDVTALPDGPSDDAGRAIRVQ